MGIVARGPVHPYERRPALPEAPGVAPSDAFEQSPNRLEAAQLIKPPRAARWQVEREISLLPPGSLLVALICRRNEAGVRDGLWRIVTRAGFAAPRRLSPPRCLCHQPHQRTQVRIPAHRRGCLTLTRCDEAGVRDGLWQIVTRAGFAATRVLLAVTPRAARAVAHSALRPASPVLCPRRLSPPPRSTVPSPPVPPTASADPNPPRTVNTPACRGTPRCTPDSAALSSTPFHEEQQLRERLHRALQCLAILRLLDLLMQADRVLAVVTVHLFEQTA